MGKNREEPNLRNLESNRPFLIDVLNSVFKEGVRGKKIKKGKKTKGKKTPGKKKVKEKRSNS